MKIRSNLFDITGRTALITGATGLLGIEHAKALLEIGAHVIITDVDENNLTQLKVELQKEFFGSRIEYYLMDVTDEEKIISVLNILLQENLFVDILINNASINPKVEELSFTNNTSRLEFFSKEQWDKELAVGLTGAFLCSKIFGNNMAKRKIPGVILNISSDLSVFSPDQRIYRKEGISEEMQPVKPVTYSVIKAGLVGLNRYLATYWADKGVRSNCLSPGGIFNGQSEEFVLKLTNLIPMGRMAHKNEYHGAIQFLCSDASAYLNGQNIVMDGGRSVW
jgi:NAD(P)-dependent dehydrogenase (short-subunit alcohol dehydrogenase family)